MTGETAIWTRDTAPPSLDESPAVRPGGHPYRRWHGAWRHRRESDMGLVWRLALSTPGGRRVQRDSSPPRP